MLYKSGFCPFLLKTPSTVIRRPLGLPSDGLLPSWTSSRTPPESADALQIDPEALLAFGSVTSWFVFGLVFSFVAAENGLGGVLGSSGAASRCSRAPPGTFWGALRCDWEFQNLPYELMSND